MYSIRYIFKKDGSQLAFWQKNVSQFCLHTQLIADEFIHGCPSNSIVDTGWVCEEPNFWRRKIVFEASSEETNFALHVTVGLESKSNKSGI